MKHLRTTQLFVAGLLVLTGCGGGGGGEVAATATTPTTTTTTTTPTTTTNPTKLAELTVEDDFEWNAATSLTLSITSNLDRDALVTIENSQGQEVFSGLVSKSNALDITLKAPITETEYTFTLQYNSKTSTPKTVTVADLSANGTVALELQIVDNYVAPSANPEA